MKLGTLTSWLLLCLTSFLTLFSFFTPSLSLSLPLPLCPSSHSGFPSPPWRYLEFVETREQTNGKEMLYYGVHTHIVCVRVEANCNNERTLFRLCEHVGSDRIKCGSPKTCFLALYMLLSFSCCNAPVAGHPNQMDSVAHKSCSESSWKPETMLAKRNTNATERSHEVSQAMRPLRSVCLSSRYHIFSGFDNGL